MNFQKKIVSLASLKRIVQKLRRQGKAIVFTNGCFDILHYGHVSYLDSAKKNGRILIVALNSDSSIHKIKGNSRPIIPQKSRAAVLAGLTSVDYVTIFNEETPLNCIQALKPDVLIKGADWRGKEVVGADVVKENGGKIEFITYQNHFSSSEIIHSILKKIDRGDLERRI